MKICHFTPLCSDDEKSAILTFDCSLCQKQLLSETDLTTHLAGKQHKKKFRMSQETFDRKIPSLMTLQMPEVVTLTNWNMLKFNYI